MPRFAASLTVLFAEAPFLERFALARRAGFRAVECQNPYPWPADEIRRRLDAENLEMVLVNAPAGDGEKGERGFAALPGRADDFRESLERGLAYARALSCSRLHVLAGNAPAGMDRAEMERTYVANLRYAAERAAGEGIRVLIEPLNPADAPGYFLNRMEQARALAEAAGREGAKNIKPGGDLGARSFDLAASAAGHPNLWLQYDVYHAQMSGELLAETFRRHASRIAHIQIAGVPGRHEPMPSDIAYGDLFKLFDDSGYDGWIGCEYRPRAGTTEGLAWAAPFGIGARAPQ